MSARSVALFIHLLGFATLFFAMGLTQRAGARAKGAASLEEVRQWLGFARSARPMFPVAFVLILLSGLYLANAGFSFETPWVVVGIVTVFLMGAIGQGVAGRGLAMIGKAAGGARSLDEVAPAMARPAPWIAFGVLNGLAVVIVWLMVDKPGWGESVGVMAALALLGAVTGVMGARRT